MASPNGSVTGWPAGSAAAVQTAYPTFGRRHPFIENGVLIINGQEKSNTTYPHRIVPTNCHQVADLFIVVSYDQVQTIHRIV